MTVSELIEKLKEFPPDRMVVVSGYEDGYDDIETRFGGVKSVELRRRGYDTDVLGKYDKWEDHHRDYYPEVEPFFAVVIPR